MSSLPKEAPYEAYTNKPDPDQPWRYACPECESVSVRENKAIGPQSLRKDSEGIQYGCEGMATPPSKYYCRSCKHAFGESELVDRREDTP